MDSWVTIILTLLLLIVPAIIKAKKEKEQQGRNINNPAPFEPEEIFEYEEETSEPEEKPIYQSIPVAPVEEGGSDRIPTVNVEHFQVEHTTEKKSKEKIDVQKLIIYSEIMKPKFEDF